MRFVYDGKNLSGDGPESASGVTFNGSPVVQIVQRARATDIAILDRLRRQNTWAFSVARQHANLGAAEHHLATHADSLANTGALVVSFEADNGAVTGKVTFAQATVSCSVSMAGVTTITTYSITCGKGT